MADSRTMPGEEGASEDTEKLPNEHIPAWY